MKAFFKKYKTACKITLLITGFLATFVLGGMIGIQYFYEDFLALKSWVQDAINWQASTEVQAQADEETADAQDFVEVQALQAGVMSVNGTELFFDFTATSHTWYDVGQMSTLIENTFAFGDFSDYDIWLEGQAVESNSEVSISLEQLGVAIGVELKFVHKETGDVYYYYVRTLHSTYDSYVSGEGTGDGYYYYTQNGTIYKMDMSGNIVFYKEANSVARDFKAYEFDGEIYYTYIESAAVIEEGSYSQMSAVVMNANYEEIDRVDYMLTDEGLFDNQHLEGHDFVMLGVGHYLVSSYVSRMVDNIPTDVESDGASFVIASVIQEIKDGELIFQWDSTEHEELYAISIYNGGYDADDEVIDYVHFNSFEIDPKDGNIILSFRHLNSIIKIDRESGEIIWILGGTGDEFGLTDDQLFSYQHFAKFYDDDTIVFYDNGNANEATRVIEIVLDEENKTVVSFKEYAVEGTFSTAMGSAMRLDDETDLFLVGWGSRSPDGIAFSEIDFSTGEVYFQYMNLDSAFTSGTYRVYKFDY